MGAALDRSTEPANLIDRFLEDRSADRAKRLRSELQRIGRFSAGLDLERLEDASPTEVAAGVRALRARYAKDTVQTSVKVFKAYVRFVEEIEGISAETSRLLQEATSLDRAPRTWSSLFPLLMEECERLPSPRRERDTALMALWAGTKLSWRKLAALSIDEYRAQLSEAPVARFVEPWLRVRGDRPGYVICKIVGDTALPDQGNNEASLRGLVGARLEELAPELEAGTQRGAAARSFARWMPQRR